MRMRILDRWNRSTHIARSLTANLTERFWTTLSGPHTTTTRRMARSPLTARQAALRLLGIAARGALLQAGLGAARTVVVGDSIMAGRDSLWGPPQISGRLEELSGTKIENHAIIGASLHEGWVRSVPQLYAELDKQKEPITTIIMNGGGNDVITVRDDCVKFNDRCKAQIDDAMLIAGDLLDKMQREGVQHVLYLGFYKVDLLGAAVEYGADQAKATCENAAVHCIYVETRDMDVKTGFDHVHPTWRSYRDLADRIWEVAQANDVPF